MNRSTDRTDSYQRRRAVHHRHPSATAAANRLALDPVTRVAATSRHSFLRDLAARAAHQLTTTESLDTHRQAIRSRLGGTPE